VPINRINDYNPSKKKKSTKGEKNSKQMRKRSWLLIWLGLTGVATISATAGAMLAVSLSTSTPLQQTLLSPEEEAVFNTEETISQSSLQIPKLNRPVNILVLGTKVLTSDVKTSTEESAETLGYHALVNSFEGNTDTMLLIRFDPSTNKLTALSIPRDTQVQIEGHGEQKINSANVHGGPALAAETVSELLGGIKIDRYITINVQGVEKLIDALGGVTVYVPKDIKYQDDSQHLYINLKQGEQHLNGEKALQLLRFRYDAYGDISRIQRQQMVMRALMEQALSPGIVVKIPNILSVVQTHIDTNLSVKELVALTGFAVGTEKSDIEMLMLPGGFNGDSSVKVSYWLPDRDKIDQMLAKNFGQTDTENNDGTIQGTDINSLSIAIQNSTEDPEAAQAMVDYLRKSGFGNVYVSQEEGREKLTKTRIVAQKGDSESAITLRDAIGMGEVRTDTSGAIESDLTIQIGTDWQEQIESDNGQ
jgi:polyisoprenyl-teichoic acid--peptidoglycan teichoic acid transferase